MPRIKSAIKCHTNTRRKAVAKPSSPPASSTATASASTTAVDLLKNAPAVPGRSNSASNPSFAAGFEAYHALYGNKGQGTEAKAQAFDKAQKLIREQEIASRKVGKLEKQILALFGINEQEAEN